VIIEEFKTIQMCWMYGGHLTVYRCKEVADQNCYSDMCREGQRLFLISL